MAMANALDGIPSSPNGKSNDYIEHDCFTMELDGHLLLQQVLQLLIEWVEEQIVDLE